MISIIITTYGRPTYLKRAIESILNNSFLDYEIIVVDDNGIGNRYSSETKKLMENYENKKIKYIQHEVNSGANKARNTGIKEADGEYVALLDDDDIFYPNKLQEIARIIEKNKDVSLIYSGAVYKNEKSNSGKYKFVSSENPKFDILVHNFIGSNSFVVLKKEKLEELNCFDETLESCQDWDMWIRIIHSNGKIFGVNKPLVEYTIHDSENRISKNRDKRVRGHEKLFDKSKIYLNNFSEQDQNKIKAYQQKRIAYIEYTSGNIEKYRVIIQKIKNDIKMTNKDKIKYYLSQVNIYLIGDKIKCYKK